VTNLFDGMVRLLLPAIPRSVLWSVARRYVAGASLEDALQRIELLRDEGYGTILDVLGEGEHDEGQARAAADEYLRALPALASVDPDTPLSVKPTHLGLGLGVDLCAELLAGVCRAAASRQRRVRLEMEDAPTIDGTLAVFRRLRAEHENLGIVLQSRLFRTAGDVSELLAEPGPPLDVRLVKGIYLEPASIAWTDGADISRSYVQLAERLVAGGAFVGFATHDSAVADACVASVAAHGGLQPPRERRRYEFQLLMGVRLDEAERLRQAGHPVRIYVPYGKDWHPYTLRRLKRNPQIARHVTRAFFGLR